MLNKFFLLPSTVALVVPLSLINLGSGVNNEIILATYQSYIKDEIATQAYDEFSLKTIYFENDKEIFSGFASGAFDLAIVSSSTLEEAVKKGLVKKIDWSRFTNTISQKIKRTEVGGRTGGAGNTDKKGEYDFSKLYSPVVNKFFSNSTEIKDYGIPYFLSYFMFAYRGEELKAKDTQGSQAGNNEIQSWSELIDVVSKDPRFKPTDGFPKLGLIEDELTIFSFSKLSSKLDDLKTKSKTIEDLFKDLKRTQTAEKIYRQLRSLNKAGLSSKMGANSLLLNPDSMALSEMLHSGDLKGIFTYNGDALATFDMMNEEGGEEGEGSVQKATNNNETSEKTNWPEENYKEMRYTPVLKSLQDKVKKKLISAKKEETQKNENNENKLNFWVGNPYLWFLDSIVISAKVSPEKESKIYKFLEKLSFTGMEDKTNTENQNSNGSNNTNQTNRNDSLEYQLLFGKVDFEKCLNKDSSPKTASTKAPVASSVEKCSIVFERGFEDEQNLNLALAFQKWKNNY